MLLLVLVALLLPGRDGLSVEDDHVEEGVQQQNGVRPHRGGIQQHRLRRTGEGVREQGGLQHDEGVRGAFSDQNVAIHRLFVRRGVETLQELGPATSSGSGGSVEVAVLQGMPSHTLTCANGT